MQKRQTIESIQRQIKKREKQKDSLMVSQLKRESTEKEKSRLNRKSELTEKVLSKYFDPESLSDLGWREILLQGAINRNKAMVKYAVQKGLTRVINSVEAFQVFDSDTKLSKQLVKELYFDAMMRIENEEFEDANERRNLYELLEYLYLKL